MRKIIKCGFLLFIGMILPAVVINAENVVEIEEGVYQIIEDGEESYFESGNDNMYSEDVTSSGSNDGENVALGSTNEQASEEGNNNNNAEKETTDGNTDSGSGDDVLNKLEIIDNNIIELNYTLTKVMISIWVLAGLFLGTKLIRGMFGYG